MRTIWFGLEWLTLIAAIHHQGECIRRAARYYRVRPAASRVIRSGNPVRIDTQTTRQQRELGTQIREGDKDRTGIIILFITAKRIEQRCRTRGRSTLYDQFKLLLFIPIASALNQAVWQIKIPPDLQGRVFAIRGMIATSIVPLANLLAGPLADNLFEPLMASNGALADTFLGTFLGTGPGRGIAIIFLISAVFIWLSSLVIFAYPRVRNLEEEVPDAITDDEGLVQASSEELIQAEAASSA